VVLALLRTEREEIALARSLVRARRRSRHERASFLPEPDSRPGLGLAAAVTEQARGGRTVGAEVRANGERR
jgi:hypothetical protein